ncbi:hypothetical protein M3Y94_00149400 [Aphelenchoides besseyi]|nr:hypothetical protein M3Y94_00149400 [Aphelenchoides besseyi]
MLSNLIHHRESVTTCVTSHEKFFLELHDTEYPKERIKNLRCAQVMFKTTALLTTNVADDSAIGESSKNRAVGYSLDFGRFIVNKGTITPTEEYELRNDHLYTVWVGSYPKPLTVERLNRYRTALYCLKIEECDFNVLLANRIREECPWKSSLPMFENVITQRRFENDIQTDRIPQSVQSEAEEEETEIASSIMLLGLIVEESNEVLQIFCPSENRFYQLASQSRFQVGDMCMFKFKDEIDGVYQDADANLYPFVDVRLVTPNLIQATLAVRLKQFNDAQMTSDWQFYGESVLGKVIIPQTMTFSPDARSVQVRAVYLYTPIKNCRWISVHTTDDLRNPTEEVDVCDTIVRILDIGNSAPQTTNNNANERKESSNQIPDSLFMVDDTTNVQPLLIDLNTNNVPDQPIQDQLIEDELIQIHPIQEQPIQHQPIQEQLIQGQWIQGEPIQEQLIQGQWIQGEPIQDQLIQDHQIQEQPIQEQLIEDQPEVLPPPISEEPEFNDDIFTMDINEPSAIRTIYEEDTDDEATNSIQDSQNDNVFQDDDVVVENSPVMEQNEETHPVVDDAVPSQTELSLLQDNSAETFLSSDEEEAYFLGGKNEAASDEPEIPNVITEDVLNKIIPQVSDAETESEKDDLLEGWGEEATRERFVSESSESAGGDLYVGFGDETDNFHMWNQENTEEPEDEGGCSWLSPDDPSTQLESTDAVNENNPSNYVALLPENHRRQFYANCVVDQDSPDESNPSIDYGIESDDELIDTVEDQDEEINEPADPAPCRPLFGGSAPNYSPDIRPKSPDTKQNMIVHLPDEDEGGFTTDEDD